MVTMTNEAAERLLRPFYAYRERDLHGPVPPMSDEHPRLDYDRTPKIVVLLVDAHAALAAERKATVERIRAALDAQLDQYHYHGQWAGHFLAILDAEAAL